jgi:hypothetical protein
VDRISSNFKIFAGVVAMPASPSQFAHTHVAVGKDFFEEDPEPEEDAAAVAAAAAASAAQAEKRKLRKEAAAASAAAAGPSAAAAAASAPAAASQGGDEAACAAKEQQKPQSKQAHVRGKSGQRKKMKEKYRDQGDYITQPQHLFMLKCAQMTTSESSRLR